MQEHECECLKECPYFNSDTMQQVDLSAETHQQEYCLKDNSKCARYIVFEELGSESVPDDLLPFDLESAQQIIENAEILLLA